MMPDAKMSIHTFIVRTDRSRFKTKITAAIIKMVPLNREKMRGFELDLVNEFQPMWIPAEVRTRTIESRDIRLGDVV